MNDEIYVTVGTIQFEIGGRKNEIQVTPTSDFTVNFGKDKYIVLLPLNTKETKETKETNETKIQINDDGKLLGAKFKKLENSIFTVCDLSNLVLTELAVKRTVVEIRLFLKPDGEATVVSLKIPATS